MNIQILGQNQVNKCYIIPYSATSVSQNRVSQNRGCPLKSNLEVRKGGKKVHTHFVDHCKKTG